MSKYPLKVKAVIVAGSLAVMAMIDPGESYADYLTAADLMRTMSGEQRYYFITGVIAGLATPLCQRRQ